MKDLKVIYNILVLLNTKHMYSADTSESLLSILSDVAEDMIIKMSKLLQIHTEREILEK